MHPLSTQLLACVETSAELKAQLCGWLKPPELQPKVQKAPTQLCVPIAPVWPIEGSGAAQELSQLKAHNLFLAFPARSAPLDYSHKI